MNTRISHSATALLLCGSILLLSVSMPSARSQAQAGRWMQTNGPTGGSVVGIEISDTGELFIAVKGHGVYRSIDGALTWEPRSDGLTAANPKDLLRTRDGVMLLAKSDGVFRSTNGGQGWSPSNSGLTNLDLQSLEQADDGRVYLATWGAGLSVSVDDGLTWSPAGLAGKKVYFITSEPTGDLFASIYGEGLFRSTDQGGSWTHLSYPNNYCYSFEETAAGDDFASGHMTGVHRSQDRGQTWEQCNGLDPGANTFMIRGTESGEIFIGMPSGDVFLHRSNDRGETWQPFDAGIRGGNLTDLVMTPSNDFFLAHAEDGVYRRLRNDTAWSRSNGGLIATSVGDLETLDDGTILAGCLNGLFRSENDGIDWLPSNDGLSFGQVVDICDAGPALLFAIVWMQGIYTSTDDGLQWRKLTNGFTSRQPQQILRDAQGNMYVGTLSDGMFFSSDTGASWEQRKGDYAPSASIDMTLTQAGTLLLTTYDAGLQRSVNQGRNWTASGSGLGGASVWGFGIHGSEVWASTSDGPFRSTDDGLSWQKLDGTPFSSDFISAFNLRDPQRMFVSAGHRIFRSTDDGAAWQSISEGVTDDIECFAFTRSGDPLAGTSRNGVLRYLPPTANAEITIGTNPDGREYMVDGSSYTSTQTFIWPVGSTHELSTAATQDGPAGARYLWSNWSDGGARTHTIGAATGASTVTANFRAEYLLTLSTVGAGTVTPATGWRAHGAQVEIRAIPDAGQTFLRWDGSGTGSYSGTNNPATIIMNGAVSQTAHFIQSTDVDIPPVVPRTLVLGQNAPNPCGAHTSFLFGLPSPQYVTLRIHDLLGRECARVVNRERRDAGMHVADFDASSLRPGVYVYRLDAESGSLTGRLVVVR